MPRTYHFNRVVAVDLFFVDSKNGQITILNILDHGTGFQVCEVASWDGHKDAENTWRAFERSWLRYFGPPEILMSDGGGEFMANFERGCEHYCIFQHVCGAYSPRQNGRCEHHGGWIKEAVSKTTREMEPQSREEMESIIHEAVSSKNRYFHREGFSPYQLVIGENPRLPKELLSDEAIDEVGVEDLSGTATDTDTAAAAFPRKHQVRQSARQNLMRMEAKSRVAEAVTSRASTPKSFAPGQWVYVWRKVKGRAKTHVLQRDRWVGPGAVVWQNCQTVWVAMRSRLWKCSSLQVRSATRAESLGAELLDEVAFKELQQDLKDPGKRVGATDVESEGTPPPQAWGSPQPASLRSLRLHWRCPPHAPSRSPRSLSQLGLHRLIRWFHPLSVRLRLRQQRQHMEKWTSQRNGRS